MSKKINQLDAATNEEAANDSYLLPLADPVNGVAKKVSVSQIKNVLSIKRKYYTGLGTEGDTLTLSELESQQVLVIFRGLGPVYEAETDPESDEYTWDQVDIVFGAEINLGEKFIILYKQP